MGDVTDKGMPAALVMASCRTVLRGVALAAGDELTPAEVLRRANELLVGDIPEAMFITCLYGVLDTGSGHFRFANAGHVPPLWSSASATKVVMAKGMPLGLMSGMEYEEAAVILAPGDLILLSSDGITEAHSPKREMFGFERLRQAFERLCHEPLESLVNDHRQFTGPDWEQEDDITLITLNRRRSEDFRAPGDGVPGEHGVGAGQRLLVSREPSGPSEAS